MNCYQGRLLDKNVDSNSQRQGFHNYNATTTKKALALSKQKYGTVTSYKKQ